MAHTIYGENLIKYPYDHTTRSTVGVTFTDNGDRSVTVKGTATSQATFYVSFKGENRNDLELPAGTYTISGGTSDVAVRAAYSYTKWASETWSLPSNESPVTITLTKPVFLRVAIIVSAGVNANDTVTPRLCATTTLNDTYQLVLFKNRVVAYGSDCFLAMGDTVICTETGRRFEHATIATTTAPPPCDLALTAYEYDGANFRICEPFGKTDGGYIVAACDDCRTPRQTTIPTAKVKELVETYATIDVTYPSGSVCTLKKDAITLTAERVAGFERFNVATAGVWTITISNGTKTQTKTVDITKRWQYEAVTISYFAATIKVTYPAGSTLTCSDGTTTLNATNTSGSYTFTVPNAGEWTVKATYDGKTASEEVNVESSGQSFNVTLNYDFYIVTSGSGLASGYSMQSSNGASVTRNGDGTMSVNGLPAGNAFAYVSPALDLSKYSVMYIRVKGGSNSVCVYGFSASPPTGAYISPSTSFVGHVPGTSDTAEQTLSLAIGDWGAGPFYPAVAATQHVTGEAVRIYEWWLE